MHEAPTRDWLAELVARASTLGERIEGDVELDLVGSDRTARRRARWVDAVARGEEADFAKRLALDAIDPDRVPLLVGNPRPSAAPLPDWANLLSEAIVEAASPDDCLSDPLIDHDDPVPAEALAVPFVRAARRRLDASSPAPECVTAAAHASSERWLMRSLSRRWWTPWDGELAAERDRRWGRLVEHVRRAERWTGRELRADVARTMLSEFQERLGSTPALARLLAVMSTQWVDTMNEFLGHLDADLDEIAREFAHGGDLGDVVGLEWGLSDPHRGGRSVAFVSFASGTEVVYKPKDLRCEHALSELLMWLNERGFEPSFAPLRVLCRGDHGWVERARQQPVDDESAAARYYERAGGVLALMRALGGCDCHYENVVAAGEHPHLVDGETILQPPGSLVGAEDEEEWAAYEAGRQLISGVLGVGLLPGWFIPPGGERGTDLSGLGRHSDQPPIQETTHWLDVGTDLERLSTDEIAWGAGAHELLLGGEVVRVEDWEAELVRGFETAYDLLERGRDDLTAAGGPLDSLAPAPVRVIFRPTRLYARLLSAADARDYLGEGVERSFGFERLARAHLPQERPELSWPIVGQELHDLERGDIPYFEVPANGVLVHAPATGRSIELKKSALTNALDQLALLGPTDRARQVALIRASLATRGEDEAAVPVDLDALPRDGEPLDAARRIGETILAQAIEGEESLAWLGALQHERSGRFQIRPTGPDLYEGQPGIAILFATLARLDGDAWLDPFRRTMAPLLRAEQLSAHALARSIGIGGGAGVGGVVHALVRCAALLDDPSLLDVGVRLIDAVHPDAIGDDRALDLMGGSTGLVLGALWLHEATGDRRPLEIATQAGERLLELERPNPVGGGSWRTLPGEPDLQGIAHGAAGCALALCRLTQVLGDDRFADAARRALEFEQAIRDDECGWPDLRERSIGPDGRWCYGSPGIGMSRLAIRRIGALDELHEGLDDDVAIAAGVAAHAAVHGDHLCCGMAGVAEFARALNGDAPAAMTARVDEWVAATTALILAGRPLTLSGPRLATAQNPGLYQGSAGVALALLGVADPSLPIGHAWT